MSRNQRSFDGVLLFDKPLELSSNGALQKVRRLFCADKAGHTGTLDPLATGLLPICFGEATKFAGGLLDADKTYRAQVRLGITTRTGDAEGEVLETRPVAVSEAQLHVTLQQFLGEIQQLPPMYSALKHQGKPLYEYIRQGETIAREARSVVIHDLQLGDFVGDTFVLTVRCSKGTYIRTLAEDIGAALGCGAHLAGLRRTAIAQFSLEQAYTLDELIAMSDRERDAKVAPTDALLPNLPTVQLDAKQVQRMAQGQRLGDEWGVPDGMVRLYHAGQFIGTGELLGRRLAPCRLLSRVAKQAANSMLNKEKSDSGASLAARP
jgi:tRNA pseudouridine55 synthase